MVKSKTIACNFVFSEEKCDSEMTLFIISKARFFFLSDILYLLVTTLSLTFALTY